MNVLSQEIDIFISSVRFDDLVSAVSMVLMILVGTRLLDDGVITAPEAV
jgi:hypothetical protein